MYEVPAVGTHYWHGRTGYQVTKVDQALPVRVHFVRDPGWEESLHVGLPDEYVVDGGRQSDDGVWHFTVVRDAERPTGWSFGEDCESTIRAAVSDALAALPRAEAAG